MRLRGARYGAAYLRYADPYARFYRYLTLGNECWLWTGPKNKNGYGVYVWNRAGKRAWTYAHRWFFEEFHDRPIVDGLTLDHLCRTPLCVRPAHLEEVTPAENTRRAMKHRKREPLSATCVQGHEDWQHGVRPNGQATRRCRTCSRERTRTRRAAA